MHALLRVNGKYNVKLRHRARRCQITSDLFTVVGFEQN